MLTADGSSMTEEFVEIINVFNQHDKAFHTVDKEAMRSKANQKEIADAILGIKPGASQKQC